jgi:hypothetical protein
MLFKKLRKNKLACFPKTQRNDDKPKERKPNKKLREKVKKIKKWLEC